MNIVTAYNNARTFLQAVQNTFTAETNLSANIASDHDDVHTILVRKSWAAHRKHFAFKRLVDVILNIQGDDFISLRPRKISEKKNNANRKSFTTTNMTLKIY